MHKKVLLSALALVGVLPLIPLAACTVKAQARCVYKIEAEYFAEGRLEGNMSVTVPNNTKNAISEIPFALYGNAFRERTQVRPVSELFASACYYDGESFGGMEITEVQGAKAYDIGQGDVLSVQLASPLYPDESVTLDISYTMRLAKANHRLGLGENCVNLSYFYPMLFAQNESGFYEYTPAEHGDPFVLDCADFSVSLTVPAGMGAASGGMAACKEGNDKLIYSYEAQGVRDVAFVLGDFSTVSAKTGAVTIDYYYFADENPERTLQIASDAISTYSSLFGAYPYDRFALAETDLFLGGMEYSGFATVSALLRQEERAAAVVHEVAHQWWYALVGSDQSNCAWQDEGLAEYSAALFFEKHPDYGTDARALITASENAYRSYYSVKSQLSGEVDTSMSRPLASYAGDYEYRILAYDKGVVLFDRLRQTMGDYRFFAALKNYAKRYAGRLATEYDLIGCFSSQEGLILSFTEGRCVI